MVVVLDTRVHPVIVVVVDKKQIYEHRNKSIECLIKTKQSMTSPSGSCSRRIEGFTQWKLFSLNRNETK